MTQTPQPKVKFADRNVIAEKAEQDISPEKDFTWKHPGKYNDHISMKSYFSCFHFSSNY